MKINKIIINVAMFQECNSSFEVFALTVTLEGHLILPRANKVGGGSTEGAGSRED